MHRLMLNKIVTSVRKRIKQGDCPTEPAFSVETLENAIEQLVHSLERIRERLRDCSSDLADTVYSDQASENHFEAIRAKLVEAEYVLENQMKADEKSPLAAAVEKARGLAEPPSVPLLFSNESLRNKITNDPDGEPSAGDTHPDHEDAARYRILRQHAGQIGAQLWPHAPWIHEGLEENQARLDLCIDEQRVDELP